MNDTEVLFARQAAGWALQALAFERQDPVWKRQSLDILQGKPAGHLHGQAADRVARVWQDLGLLPDDRQTMTRLVIDGGGL